MTDPEPFLTPPGWGDAVVLTPWNRPSYRVLFYGGQEVRFEHRCDRGDRGVVICAPALQIENGGHRVVQRSPLTIEPSILCPDCGTHGFVRDGKWVEA